MPLFTPLRDMSYYLFNNLTFFFSLPLLISLVRHRDTLRPTGLITLNSYFLKCNIYRHPGTYTPRVLLHITDFFILCLTKMKGRKD